MNGAGNFVEEYQLDKKMKASSGSLSSSDSVKFVEDEDRRTGLSVDALKRAFLDKLVYTQARFPEVATRRDQADFLRPYELLERVLTRHDGRRKLLARLGSTSVSSKMPGRP